MQLPICMQFLLSQMPYWFPKLICAQWKVFPLGLFFPLKSSCETAWHGSRVFLKKVMYLLLDVMNGLAVFLGWHFEDKYFPCLLVTHLLSGLIYPTPDIARVCFQSNKILSKDVAGRRHISEEESVISHVRARMYGLDSSMRNCGDSKACKKPEWKSILHIIYWYIFCLTIANPF